MNIYITDYIPIKNTKRTIMNKINFYDRNLHTDLEIQTNDVSLFVNRIWLMNVSPYFRALLTNGMIESRSNIIKLHHDSSLINSLFTIIYSLSFVECNYIESNLIDISVVYRLFYICDEYQLHTIKNFLEKYLLNFLDLSDYISTDLTDLIDFIIQFELNSMKHSLRELLINNRDILNKINFSKISCETLKFFYCDASLITDIFSRWVTVNDPEDNEIKYMYVIFSFIKHAKLSRIIDKESFAETILTSIGKLTKAIKFKRDVYELLTPILY
uniref:BTB domain-containing protein n=1 Tax=viral metagenome TaxID=1070528 RepID=A0A6C0LR19_9ZZZZ